MQEFIQSVANFKGSSSNQFSRKGSSPEETGARLWSYSCAHGQGRRPTESKAQPEDTIIVSVAKKSCELCRNRFFKVLSEML